MGQERRASRAGVVGCLAILYLVWGSTYLGMRVAMETAPPFLTGGTRFFLAGAVLYVWASARGIDRPTARQWGNAAFAGVLMLLVGNGCVAWAMAAEKVPSGLAALTVATTPAWMVLLDWAWGGPRPRALVGVGIAAGLAGVAVLAGAGAGGVSVAGAAVLTLASVSWAVGSLFARHADLPRSPARTTGMEMLAGGAALAALGAAAGEHAGFDPAGVSLASALAFGYLLAAAVVAMSAFTWLMTVADPGLVGTYAFVNPVVAVVLGAALADEELTARTGAAAALVVLGVALIVWPRPPAK
ncbi:MAG: EamA family transporter [Gemmataceae bacterium]|nr:EamA family transporter [Gemmataceae bacterium]